jgi:hypothetical protein
MKRQTIGGLLVIGLVAAGLVVPLPVPVPAPGHGHGYSLGYAHAQPKPTEKKAPPPPQIVFSDPLAVTPGTTTKLKLRGLQLDTITQLSVGEPRTSGRIVGKPGQVAVPNNLPVHLYGNSHIEVELTLPADVAGATLPITVTGPGGTSKVHRLIINDDTPRVSKKGRIAGFAQAMPLLTIPVVVEGRIEENGLVDVYSFKARAGERFVFEVQAARFGVPLDSLLTVYDEQIRQLAHNDDFADSADSQIRFTAPGDGTYYLVVADAHDLGGPTHLYRLLVRRE